VSEKHCQNVQKGELIKIGGNEFVKVKLKFVDTTGYNLANYVDTLEFRIPIN